jgi:hypothetical protein
MRGLLSGLLAYGRGRIMTFDEAIEAGILDEYGCHKKCGEYFYKCECHESFIQDLVSRVNP